MVAFAAMAALTAPSAEAAPRQVRPAPPTEATAPREAGEPIMAIVSIKSQTVTIYDADGWILRAPVSTGTTGRETPAGIFAIVEKNREHRSTLYDDASMPHMQRITWNGIALHGGPLPGYAASHGCVRMPFGFAEKLFDKTRIGMRVIVSPNDAVPVDFSHPAFLVPKQDAIAAAPARIDPAARAAEEAAKVADAAKKAIVTLTREAAVLKASLQKLEWGKKIADNELVFATKAIAAADQAKARAEAMKQKAAAKVADVAKQLEAADQPAARQKLEWLKKGADAELAMADKMLAAADQGATRAEEQKQKATAKAADMGKQLDTAKANAKQKADAAVAAKDGAKAAETKKAETAKVALEAKLALEPVQIYISRETKKLYVRRNTHKPLPDQGVVFDATIEVPITIRNPEKRIGTHVFTAMAKTDGGLRWSAVSIDGEDAREALDRVTIPQEILDRLGPTAMPRSSIIISDEPLSKETNYRTEFVVVLANHPQGGFITRKPTPKEPRDDYRVASRDDGFFSFFGRSNWGEPQPVDPREARRRRSPGPGPVPEYPRFQQRW